MKLLLVLAATLAISLAESEHQHHDDLEALESIELQKTDDLKPSASVYNSVPWTQPQQYIPPTPIWTKPQVPYVPGFGQNPVQSDYVAPPVYQPPTSTTPSPVIKNEQYFGSDGSYRYEYQIADGTWVGEQGYYTDPKHTDESLVKKGWYQYKANDGKIYTVTYWADHTGYHAFGDHLPVAPPTPPAIQASIDQKEKEEAEKNKPYYPPTQKPIYYDPPQQPSYPTQTQQPSYPIQTQQPSYPTQTQQPSYPQPQQPFYPPQQSQHPNYHSQPQPYYPSQPKYNTYNK